MRLASKGLPFLVIMCLVNAATPVISSEAPSIVNKKVMVAATNDEWTPTEIKVQAGDLLVIITSGNVAIGAYSGEVDADGNASGEGALIGKIGVGAGFTVGDRTVIPVDAEGTFKLKVKDGVYSDNRGQFEVMVLHIPAGAIPEPVVVTAE